jgi:glycosyltransferase involved in cell wall biosynthesis
MATSKKKILFLSYDGMTDPLGQSQVIPYLIGLSKYDYDFTILSCDKPDNYKANKEYVQKLITPYPIQWVSLPYHKQPPILSSLYDFWLLKRKAEQLHKKEKFDMVHTRVGLPTLVALYLQKKYSIKFLNDIRGFWADERVDGGMWNIKSPLYKSIYQFFKKKEIACLTKADYNVCLTYAAEKEIHSWQNIPAQPVPLEVIPCSVDLDLFDPLTINREVKEQFKKELRISDDDFIISYLGSIGGWYLTEEMLRFCKLVSDKIPKAKFLFISPHQHTAIANAAAKVGLLPDKLIITHAKRYEVPILLSFSNYSIFFIKPCYSKISSSPTKHGEIMSMGIPVITNSGVGDISTIIAKYNSGYVVNDFSDESFIIAINKIIHDDLFDKNTIRDGAKKFYALENAVNKYKKVYTAIFDK